MKTFDVREIINGNPKSILLNSAICGDFLLWKKLFTETTGKEPSQADIFYAGFVLSNPSVRDLLHTKTEKEIRDDRISNILWR